MHGALLVDLLDLEVSRNVGSLWLARGPCHGAAAEEMYVDVVDGLATVFAGVDDGAVSLGESFSAGDFRGGPLEVAEQVLVILFCVSDRGDVLPGDNEDMYGRLRLDVGEGVAVLILVDGFGRNASVDDLAEYAAHGESLQAPGLRCQRKAERLQV